MGNKLLKMTCFYEKCFKKTDYFVLYLAVIFENILLKMNLFMRNIFKKLIHCPISGCNFENKLENISMENIFLKMTHFMKNIFQKTDLLSYIWLM